jgi:hypothetical protein
LFLAPDLSMLGYLAGPRIGAFAYNMAHTVIWPLCLVGLSSFVDHAIALQLGAIWLAHIGLDRVLGYGLKASSGFHDTHMGRIGRK